MVLSVLGCCRRGDCCGASVTVIVTLGDDAVVGPGNCTLGCGNILGDVVVRYFASIFCSVFMSCICSSPTENGDYGAVLLRSSIKSSTAWRAVLAEDSFGTGELCVEIILP